MGVLDGIELNEHEKTLLRKRWCVGEFEGKEKEPNGQRYTVFFPSDKDGLREFEPLSLVGQVPSEGDRISFRGMSFNEDPGYEHKKNYRSWYVKKVWWSVTVQTNKKDQLLYDHIARAEVHVDYSRWVEFVWKLKMKFYYDPKRAILNKIRSWKKKK